MALQERFKGLEANIAKMNNDLNQSYEILGGQRQLVKVQEKTINDLKDTIAGLQQSLSFASTETQEKDRELERLVEENSVLMEVQEENQKLAGEKDQLLAAQALMHSKS